MKKIEWNKEVLRFYELKNRVREFGILYVWCVEVMCGNNFVFFDDNVEIFGD